jgi:hypothetical protein
MRNESPSRWLLLLAGLTAVSGCSQLPGGSTYPPVRLNPGLAAERYLSPASAPDSVAQTHTAETAWTRMGNGTPADSAPAAVTATREQPVIRTSSVEVSTLAPPAGPPAAAVADPNRPRTLWDKQPWEVELDKTVRGICRGC